MEKSKNESILTVENLNLCRCFYRDVLGDPKVIVDSSFLVKFFLPDGNWIFVLRVSSPLDNQKIRIPQLTFFQNPALLEITIRKLQHYGVKFSEIKTDRNDRVLKIVAANDPEGNTFFIESRPEVSFSIPDDTRKTQRMSI